MAHTPDLASQLGAPPILTAYTPDPASRLGAPRISGPVMIGTLPVIGSNTSTPGMTATLVTIRLFTINLDAPIPWALRTGRRPMIFPRWGGLLSPPVPVTTNELLGNGKPAATILPIWPPCYHGDDEGVMVLTEKFICDCGYNSFSPESTEEDLFCYDDIMMVHRKVIAGWISPRSGRSGPSVDYILEKVLVNFPVLHYPVARETVEFYDKLQKLLAGYLLPLMPFALLQL